MRALRWSLVVAGALAPCAPAPFAMADEPAAGGTDAENARDTARDVAHAESRTTRADLPARLADNDTADGRVEGDLGLVVGLGVAVGETLRGAAELRARYLDTAGLFVTYEDAFGQGGADPSRVLTTGLELRPLFLGRWVTGRELGIRWIDLVIDSFGLEVGTCFQQPQHASGLGRPGLQASLGLELPLGGTVNGPWLDLHGGARWSDAAIEGAPVPPGMDEATLFLSVTLAYHRLFATRVVDLNDRAP